MTHEATSRLTVGSLFAGIGGFDLAAERVGWEIKFQVEIDPFCRRVLAKHWPQVRRYDDVRTVGAQNLERVDVLCGGFPCQDISDAGKRDGITGRQSGLWREMRRIIGELRPRYVVVENVAGLLALGMGTVVSDLSAVGYDAEWGTLSACAFGAPHTRERVFIVAYPHASRRTPSWPLQMEIASAIGALASRQPGTATLRTPHWASEPGVARVADGVSAVVDRGAAIGNAIVPQVAEWIFRQIQAAEEYRSRDEAQSVTK